MARSLRCVTAPIRLVLALLLFPCGAASAEDLPVVAWQGRTMGTVYTVKIVGAELKPAEVNALKAEVEARLQKVNRQMSTYLPDSEISRFNRSPANEAFQASPELASVVRFSLNLCRRSNGSFDPTLGPVINLWGFGEQGRQRTVPSDDEIERAMRSTGWRHLSVSDAGELHKAVSGLTLNLGGVAKGFGVDEIAKLLRARKFEHFYVAIAGDVLVQGLSPRGDQWKLGIAAPVDQWREDHPMARVVSLRNRSLSTSGDYQNFFRDADGHRQSHIIDAKTGRPVRHSLAAVSVVASDSITADALGTTLFVLGERKGLEFIESWDGAEALFITRQDDGTFRQIPSSRFQELTAPPQPDGLNSPGG